MRSIKRSLITLGAVAVLAGSGCATGSGTRSAGVVIDDAAITSSIKTKLVFDKDTKARQIDVETQNGIVQLNGFVDSSAARSEAQNIAAGTDGVKQVRNNLEVRSADRSAWGVPGDRGARGNRRAGLWRQSSAQNRPDF